ncbi:ATP-binding cassette domain-containing protein [Marinobacter apostichopi]|uniref:ATP-binding cassette domain-containing protein n=1 Tax=Marinobacter apostichopi TaxID=3035454 RepID=UPI0025745367|nr:ATP-binding cassette domain-containing protein [Marinobacter sp. LA51]
MLEVRNLTFTYPSNDCTWSFDFQVGRGQCIAIDGPSGSGKSTLLGLLAGFLSPAAGTIIWQGQNVDQLAPWQRPMTSVFQEHNLFEHLDVQTNIGLGIHPGMKLSREQKQAIQAGLARVGLAGFGERMPSALSGGQRQRVALLRALLRNQPLLLLDEPLTGLDEDTRNTLRAMLVEHKAQGITIVLASHDEEDRQVLADSRWSL